MELWAIITFGSAFLQNLRSTLQKHLKGRMGTTGATFVRFGYGVPFAVLYLCVLHYGFSRPLPVPNGTFAIWAVIGAMTQIAATFLLVHIFSFRNFAVGTAYSRTEPAQAAILALLLFGEKVTVAVVSAIAISVVGVMLISVARSAVSPRTLVTSVASPTARFGLLSGLFFGMSAISYRQASLALVPSLPTPDAVMQASYTLVIVIVMQTVVMSAYMLWRDRAEMARTLKAYRIGLLVGFVGATASFGWFTAMTLQQAAIVKALAQVEILFTFASAILFFKERVNLLEMMGCLLIVGGILALLLL